VNDFNQFNYILLYLVHIILIIRFTKNMKNLIGCYNHAYNWTSLDSTVSVNLTTSQHTCRGLVQSSCA